MKIGILTVSVDVAGLAKRAEELGFDSFWIPEHTATPVHIAPKTTTYRLHLEPDGTPQPVRADPAAPPTHGTVLVTCEETRDVVDASILHSTPLAPARDHLETLMAVTRG